MAPPSKPPSKPGGQTKVWVEQQWVDKEEVQLPSGGRVRRAVGVSISDRSAASAATTSQEATTEAAAAQQEAVQSVAAWP